VVLNVIVDEDAAFGYFARQAGSQVCPFEVSPIVLLRHGCFSSKDGLLYAMLGACRKVDERMRAAIHDPTSRLAMRSSTLLLLAVQLFYDVLLFEQLDRALRGEHGQE
jgi:hypothetical protein